MSNRKNSKKDKIRLIIMTIILVLSIIGSILLLLSDNPNKFSVVICFIFLMLSGCYISADDIDDINPY